MKRERAVTTASGSEKPATDEASELRAELVERARRFKATGDASDLARVCELAGRVYLLIAARVEARRRRHHD
jgi:hypothetical protein